MQLNLLQCLEGIGKNQHKNSGFSIACLMF